MDDKPVRWEVNEGIPVTIGQTTITPQSQALIVRFPFGGFVWNRPHSIRVQHGETSQHIPIPDATRSAQLTFWLLGGIIILLLLLFSRR